MFIQRFAVVESSRCLPRWQIAVHLLALFLFYDDLHPKEIVQIIADTEGFAD